MLQLVRDVKKSVNSDLSMEWLKPFMTERDCAAGEILFYKDEKAEDMLYIVSGKFKLVESGIVLPVGAIVGELGMLSPSNMRTQTLECIEAGLVLSVSYTKSRSSTYRTRRSASTSWPAPGCFRTSRRCSSS
jgi:CRP-like cAMP-binding protein